MLTPDLIQKFNQVTGNNVSPTGTTTPMSRADEIRSLAKKPVVVTKPNLKERTSEAQMAGFETAKKGIEYGADKYMEGVEEAKKSTNLIDKAKGELKAIGGLGTSALQTIKGGIEGAFAPVTAVLSPVVEKAIPLLKKANPELSAAIDQATPKIQELADKYPVLADNTEAIMDIALLFVGGRTSKTAVEGALNKEAGAKALSDIKAVPGEVMETASTIKSGLKESALEKGMVNASDNAYKAITPRTADLTPTEYEQLLRQRKITKKTKTQPSEYILSKEEKAVAEKYRDLLQDKDPVTNSTNIMNKIANTDEEVGLFLDANNPIFNGGELKNYVSKKLQGISDVTIPEARVSKLKKQVIDNFIEELPKKDMKSLWKARKEFDQKIESAFSGSPTLQNKVKREFRDAVQEFIAEKTPDEVYKTKMKDMRELYNIHETVATKAVKERGNSWVKQWVKENPVKAKAIGLGTTILGGKAIYDVAF